jgi:hypothetical protein
MLEVDFEFTTEWKDWDTKNLKPLVDSLVKNPDLTLIEDRDEIL